MPPAPRLSPRAVPRPVCRVAGHFGELLQGRLGQGGPVVLISLPCPVLAVTAMQVPGRGFGLRGSGGLTPKRARQFLARLGLSLPGAVLMRAQMPIGGGAGSSTATLVALARLAGWTGPAQALAAACLHSEGATDPLMYPQAQRLLWASRAGRVIETLPALPACDILGGFFGPGLRTDPADDGFPDIADLVAGWRAAPGLADLAALCAASAERTLALRQADPDPIAGLARATGALGHLIAHTGSARGLIFAPGSVPAGAAAQLRAAGLRGIVQFRAGGGN